LLGDVTGIADEPHPLVASVLKLGGATLELVSFSELGAEVFKRVLHIPI